MSSRISKIEWIGEVDDRELLVDGSGFKPWEKNTWIIKPPTKRWICLCQAKKWLVQSQENYAKVYIRDHCMTPTQAMHQKGEIPQICHTFASSLIPPKWSPSLKLTAKAPQNMPYNQKAAVLLFSNHLFSGANKLFFSSFGYLNINLFCVRGSFSPVDFLYLFFAEFHRPSRHPLPCEAQRVLVSWQRTFFRSKKTHEISWDFFV